MPERIRLSRKKGWQKPFGALNVGRGSRWGNPFRVWHGSVIGPEWFEAKHAPLTRRAPTGTTVYQTHAPATAAVPAAVELFQSLVDVRRRDLPPGAVDEWLQPLRGMHLACWCPLDQPCHADILLKEANPG